MSEQLAIHNGEPIIPAGMIKPWPQITDADREAMMEVLAGVLSVTNVVGSSRSNYRKNGLRLCDVSTAFQITVA
ncbi:hypothetical protein CMK16_06180 [Candidatus Poribacteria bacterium]|nr:hypothetical protein [Candidatus Poribacteria bacterium]